MCHDITVPGLLLLSVTLLGKLASIANMYYNIIYIYYTAYRNTTVL